MASKGILFVISGPSGVGKNSCLSGVFARVDNLSFSVSATTRAPRKGEIDGVNYHFVTKERFEEMVANSELLEYVNKYTNCYGTVKSEVDKMLNEGKDVVLDIETVGADHVKRLMPECVTIFIAPPSLKELYRRLEGRGTETEESKAIRKQQSVDEMKCAYNYEYLVINDSLTACVEQISDIILSERRKMKYNKSVVDTIINTK